MEASQQIAFPPFTLDSVNECLWRNGEALALTPKAYAVLRVLIDCAGQLVTKDALLQTVWPGTYVTDTALKVCINGIRTVLGDDAKSPRFIETVHRRGYRFIAAVTAAPVSSLATQSLVLSPQHSTLVGREAELAQLHQYLAKALRGERQLVFVTGEAGIGKTTLIDTFLAYIPAAPQILIGEGQCVEHYGVGEAYLPILDALGRLCRGPGGARLIALLRQHAPLWLLQMPALLSPDDRAAVQRESVGATPERMLREMVDVVEVLTTEHPLVLVLEDLQWSDSATLSLLTALARRREAARLLVIATYRPIDVILSDHPVKQMKQELHAHRLCVELAPELLTEDEVLAYLMAQLPEASAPSSALLLLAQALHHRTEGNPLFLMSVLDDLKDQQALGQREGRWHPRENLHAFLSRIPATLLETLEAQIHGLQPEKQEVLQVASVAGMYFTVPLVSAATGRSPLEVEELCESLARREQFIQRAGVEEWPDGTLAARYHFRHALHQDVSYQRIPPMKRVDWHQKIGERREHAFATEVRSIATELAVHFEHSRDYKRAVEYLQYASEQARQRGAYSEAISLLSKGLELLKALPDTPARAPQELVLQVALGTSLTVTKGYAAPEVQYAYERAFVLCEQMGESRQLFPALAGLWIFRFLRAELHTARELATRILRLAQSISDPTLLLWAHIAQGMSLSTLGELSAALKHLEAGIALYDPQLHRPDYTQVAAQDPKVSCLSYAAWALWRMGYPDQARKRVDEALALAQELSHPFSQAFALDFAGAGVGMLLRNVAVVQVHAEMLMKLCQEQGFPYWLGWGTVRLGWVLVEQGQVEAGIAKMRQGMDTVQLTGAELSVSYILTQIAEAYGKVGQEEQGLLLLAEAFTQIEKTGERWYEAELYRLKGELTLRRASPKSNRKSQKSKRKTSPQPLTPSPQEAEACFLKAIEIAQQQQAKLLELRATVSLARLWHQEGKSLAARRVLEPLYAWFTEGFATDDLRAAKSLLDTLVRAPLDHE